MDRTSEARFNASDNNLQNSNLKHDGDIKFIKWMMGTHIVINVAIFAQVWLR